MGWWKNILLIFQILTFFKSEKIFTFKKPIVLKACSSVDRASDSDSESQGFDSLHAYTEFSKLGLFWFRHLKLINV